jgi:hypothetical protein
MKNEPTDGHRPFNCADQATPTWRQRADVCAELLTGLVPARGAPLQLADIGCGDQKLRDSLRACGVSVDYTGYDLLPQTSDVHRFDVRSDLLPRQHDVAVMLGVIEYLQDLPVALGRLARQVPYLVLSHVIRQGDTYTPEMLAKLGWVNHLALGELEELLSNSGYAESTHRLTPDGRTMLVVCVSRLQASSL